MVNKTVRGTGGRVVVTDSVGVKTHSNITSTELGYLDGATSNIQVQLSDKQSTISSTNRLNAANISTGAITNTEFNTLNGVSDNIQSQLDNLKANTVASKQVAVMVYPNTNPYWAHLTITDYGHNISMQLSGGVVRFVNNLSTRSYYLTMFLTSYGSTSGTGTSTVTRYVINGSTPVSTFSFDMAGSRTARFIISAYGGEQVDNIVINTDTVRHDSNEILVITESYIIPK